MAHISFAQTHDVPVVADAWLPATAACTQYAIRLAGRDDIAVKLGPGFAAQAGTALFTPSIATVEIDTEVMLPGVKPEDVNPFDELFRAKHLLFIGALVHEVAHSRYSQWVPKHLFDAGLGRRKIDVLIALEESRIEYRMLARHPKAREALGAIVFDLIGKDFKIGDDVWSASIASALTLGRVDAGSITVSEGRPFREALEPVLGADVLETLRPLWQEYHRMDFDRDSSLTEDQVEQMDSIATRWIEALSELMPEGEDGEGGEGTVVCEFGFEGEDGAPSGEGEGSEGSEGAKSGSEGSGGSEGGSEGQDGSEGGSGGGLGEKIREAARDAKHDKDMSAGEKVKKVKADRRAAQREIAKKRRDKGKIAKVKAFGAPGKPRGHMVEGPHGHSATGGSTIRWRKPTDRERAAGVNMSRLLEKVIYSDRRVAKVRQVEPGGRMYGRGQVQRVAEKRAKQQPQAAGWVVKKRTHTDSPKINVGVMLDVSGSMSAQARLAGSLFYALGNAVERVGGDFAGTLFGYEVYGLVEPGERMTLAPEIHAGCGTEAFGDGFAALDGVLDLVNEDGLRVLILLSDGVFVDREDAKLADSIIPMLVASGVYVLHVDIDGTASEAHYAHYNPRHNNPIPPLRVSRHEDPVEVTTKIGNMLIELVKKFKAAPAA